MWNNIKHVAENQLFDPALFSVFARQHAMKLGVYDKRHSQRFDDLDGEIDLWVSNWNVTALIDAYKAAYGAAEIERQREAAIAIAALLGNKIKK